MAESAVDGERRRVAAARWSSGVLLWLPVLLAACSAAPSVVIDADPAAALARVAAEAPGVVEFEVRLTNGEADVVQVTSGIIEPDGNSHLTLSTTYDFPDLDDETLADLGLSRGQLDGRIEMISLDGAVYQRGDLSGTPLPEGFEWSVNRAPPGAMGSTSIDMSATLGPLDLLTYLADAESVTRGSDTEIDGRPVAILTAVLPEGRDRPRLDVTVYLIDQEQVRRIRWEGEVASGSVSATLDYLDLDSPERVTAPPAEVTIDQYELRDLDQGDR